MLIKPNSKTLSRFNSDNSSILRYHETDVVTLDKQDKKLILKTGGWETMNTARAMNFAFEEMGLDVKVTFYKSRKTGETRMTLHFNDLVLPLGTRTEINL